MKNYDNRQYKQTKIGIIPNDWEVKRFDDIATFFSGGTPLTSNENYYNGKIPFIKSGEIYDVETEQFISEEGFANSSAKMVEKGDILYALYGANSGEVAISKINGAINQAILCVKLKATNSTFIHSYLLKGKNKIVAQFLQGGQGNLSAKIIKSLLLPIPPLPEQKAIADCLTTWDKGIEKTTALVNAKKQQKKAILQSIFNDELRIKNWKEVRLGDIGETFNGLTGKNKNDFGFGKPYVSYLNVFKNSKIDGGTDFDFVSISENENQQKLQYGDLIFTTSSETPNEVGMSSVILFEPIEDLFLNSFCFGFRLNDFEILYPNFAIHILREQNFRKEMYRLAQGSTRFNLSKTGFKNIKLQLPSLSEQERIANVLSTADKEIALLEQKLVALQTQKQGLMQVLLTGQLRMTN